MSMARYYQIGKVNLRFNLLPHLLLSLALLCISPVLMGVENLDASRTARVLEMFVALLGIILLTPIFLPEQNKDIKDLVEAKYTSLTAVYLIRILEGLLCLVILIGGYILVLQFNNCSFPEMKFFLGTLAEAIFLGGMGLCAYSLFNQIAVAYMLPLMYYVLAFGGGKKLLHNYYLFSMIYDSFQEKIYLVVLGFILIIIGILYPCFLKLVLRNIASKIYLR